jgi:hypothetical protein
MPLFQTKKLQITKVVKDGSEQYFIDYHKQKEPDIFIMEVIQIFAEDQNLLTVIDTEYSYDKNDPKTEDRILGLKRDLDRQGIAYRVVVTKKESDQKVLGIRLQKTEKVNVYQLGFAATVKQLGTIPEILKDNVFYYISMEAASEMEEEALFPEEMNDLFYQVRGGEEELTQQYNLQLYIDSYFQRIRICSREDISDRLEALKKKYQR